MKFNINELGQFIVMIRNFFRHSCADTVGAKRVGDFLSVLFLYIDGKYFCIQIVHTFFRTEFLFVDFA